MSALNVVFPVDSPHTGAGLIDMVLTMSGIQGTMSTVSDSPTGHDRAPDRYTTQDRETIDRMRDLAHELFTDRAVADAVFAYHCIATALKYSDRYGKKDATEIEDAKLAWYLAMAEHVIEGTLDPRSERPSFVPWEVQKIPGLPEPVARVAIRLYSRVIHGLGSWMRR